MNFKTAPRLKFTKCSSLILAAGFALATAATGYAQTLVLSLQSQNYNPTTGVWTDSSGTGNNATNAGATKPTLTTGVTPNGASAVTFTTGSFLNLMAGITAGNASGVGYTAFVFLQPSTTTPNGFTNGSGGTVFGGPNGGTFQFRLSNGHQDIVQSAQADLNRGTATLSTTSFSTIDTTTGTSGGTYRLNGAADGTSAAGNFGSSISLIGTNNTGGNDEYFNGNIADIEIYSGIMTDAQRATVEQQLTARYVTTTTGVPEPGTWAMALVGVGMLFGVQRFRARKA